MAGILSIQFNPVLGNKQRNLIYVEDIIKKHSDKALDLILLPEFFSTGISHEQFEKYPEDETGEETINRIKNVAKKYKTNIIAGTVIEKCSGKYYNTSFAIDRNGEILAKYRKIHLYNYMGGNEGELITPGENEIVVNFDFAKVGMAVCFDIRYPLHFKKLVKAGAQIIVLPTAWIIPNEVYDDKDALKCAQEMWIAMTRTRAYDNMVYIVSSNQVGRVNENVSVLGTSLIVSPTAEILANAGLDQNEIYSEIDINIVDYLKSIYPISQID